ncbi:MAG: type I-E CRISPR-associated protein Cas5/CasD [Phototrophicales bacterium]|nr:MAG: type I-E CRISPR-associated protein Cas5/CasD [Phototrophicales bacterium]RMG70782.1 MAG: type I-E CRISPR-associated protein Cas5/CasD [Chloroflexota bacterium]
MATLLIRLSAPMQAWGTKSHFSHRDTEREPSKSGVIGLLCAALGIPRTETGKIQALATLRMGVRSDKPGSIRRDFHTAGRDGYYRVSGGVETKNLITSERYYLSDAKFLVGLEGDPSMLETIHNALKNPKWFLFLGRKAFVPSERVWLPDGLQSASLDVLLEEYPRLENAIRDKLWAVIDAPDGELIRNDHPISFKPRRFIPRKVTRIQVNPPASPQQSKEV